MKECVMIMASVWLAVSNRDMDGLSSPTVGQWEAQVQPVCLSPGAVAKGLRAWTVLCGCWPSNSFIFPMSSVSLNASGAGGLGAEDACWGLKTLVSHHIGMAFAPPSRVNRQTDGQTASAIYGSVISVKQTEKQYPLSSLPLGSQPLSFALEMTFRTRNCNRKKILSDGKV